MSTANTQVQDDVFDAADNAVVPVRSFTYFGQVFVDVYACALKPGVGKVPFDGLQHKPEERRTAINLSIAPLPGSLSAFVIERQMIAESHEWASTTLPSLKALGLTTRELKDRYVRATLAPTGRKFKAKDGTMKNSTAIKFLEVYPDEAACQAAADAYFANLHDHTGEAVPESGPVAAATPAGNGGGDGHGNGSDPEKATALMFLEPLWKASNGDLQTFQTFMASNPLITKHFSINSPEVQALMKA